MSKLDPIEQVRVDMGLRDAPVSAEEPAAPVRHKRPMKPFLGADGQTYQRRGDITMREFRAFQDDRVVHVDLERYWIALFLGLLEPETISLSQEERIKLGVAATDAMLAEEYYALAEPLVDAISNPVGPKGPSPTGA